jgi:hypothetical protein
MFQANVDKKTRSTFYSPFKDKTYGRLRQARDENKKQRMRLACFIAKFTNNQSK